MSRCTHPKPLRDLVRRVQACLSPDLLRKGEGGRHPHAGHCAVASEAVWAKRARALGYKTRVGRTDTGGTHWWLVSPEGCVLDPTAAQFTKAHLSRIYARGRAAGPQGVRYKEGKLVPSERARTLLRRVAKRR
jgi:hypothetical protein